LRNRKLTLRKPKKLTGLGMPGRHVYLPDDKKSQYGTVRRLKFLNKIIVITVIAALIIAGLFAVFNIFIPYFKAQEDSSSSSGLQNSSESSDFVNDLVLYDKLGLPIYNDEVNLFVINSKSPQIADFMPETVKIDNILVEKKIAEAVRMLNKSAKADGIDLNFSVGFVSFDEQEKLFEAEVKALMEKDNLTPVMARVEARKTVGIQGECDEQSGMCLKIEADPETFKDSEVYQWLNINMGKYGFVYRFPEKKAIHTDRNADYTVIRYVGAENAEKMRQISMCLEEYITYLKSV